MKHVNLALGAMICGALTMAVPAAAQAQDDRFEAFGAVSYLFADVGGAGGDVGGIGYHGGFAIYVNDWLGFGADVGYNSGDIDIPVIQIFPTPDVDFSQWTALFGSRFRIARSDRFRVGAQAMAGIARARADVEFDPDDPLIELPGFGSRQLTIAPFEFGVEDTAFAAMLGLHFDVDVGERLVWRMVEPNLLITGYGSDAQTHFRISSGLVYGF